MGWWLIVTANDRSGTATLGKLCTTRQGQAVTGQAPQLYTTHR